MVCPTENSATKHPNMMRVSCHCCGKRGHYKDSCGLQKKHNLEKGCGFGKLVQDGEVVDSDDESINELGSFIEHLSKNFILNSRQCKTK